MKRLTRSRRIFLVMGVMFLIFSVYVLRLFQLQILQNSALASIAARQRTQKLLLQCGRGDIFDRHGISLLDSWEEEVLVVFPALIRGREQEIVADYPWVPYIEGILRKKVRGDRPYILARTNRHESMTGKELPEGIGLLTLKTRYGQGYLAPHVVGYLNKIDNTGVAGIEFFFDEELRAPYYSAVAAVVDGHGRLIPGIGYRHHNNLHNRKPYNVHLTLDSHLQRSVEKVMAATIVKGAVVVMHPFTGDILAMASKPSFAPNNVGDFFLDTKESRKLYAQKPFLNRTVRSFFPGSTFKMVVAAAALESGYYYADFEFNCHGFIQFGRDNIGCTNRHGKINLTEALAVSCNVAFIEIGLQLGSKAIWQQSQEFGFGEKVNLPLQGERSGNLPDSEMNLGILALACIGQGDVSVTPLQVARAYAVVANGGYLVRPRLVDKLTSRKGLTVRSFRPSTREKIIQTTTASKLKMMLHEVVEDGTGEEAASRFFDVAGKTGTAETGDIKDDKEELHYWFAGFIPLANPTYVIVVFIEEGKGVTPAEIFRKITEKIVR